ncbi:MAG TPA: UbiA-like protein EboC [Hanamia sp.]|nr:UbiA-like protein EboC [Hanamia sp.]
MKKIKGFLQLMRPANIITSVSDVLAGVAISGFLFEATFQTNYMAPLALLCISTMGLYGGGVVFNDVFDQALDKVERPERPIPRGLVTIKEATVLGILLLLTGIITALLVSNLSGFLAASIAIAALLYNKFSKHHPVVGPLNMGLCRGLNLLLGISIITAAVFEWWFLAFVPIIYIAAITMISRGEVHGGSKRTLYLAGLLYCIVIAAILLLSHAKGMLWWTIIFLIPFAWMIFTALIKAIHIPAPHNIGKAVKAGVIALILMNGAWAAAFGMIGLAFLIILLLPLSLWLAKIFAVT